MLRGIFFLSLVAEDRIVGFREGFFCMDEWIIDFFSSGKSLALSLSFGLCDCQKKTKEALLQMIMNEFSRST